jgi:hypothetical protein
VNGPTAGMHDGWSEEALPIRTAGNAYPLPGYARRVVMQNSLVAREPLVDALEALLRDHGTLYSWAASQPQPRALRGRAPVYVADVPHTDVTLVVRHAWHGGLLAPLTRDLYVNPTRAPLELIRTVMLRGLGIAAPELLAYVLYRVGPGVSRVDVATRYLPDAYDLGAVLADHVPAISRGDAMFAVESLLVKLAECGMVHPDLNVKNIMLSSTAGGATATMIDVDVVRWMPKQRPSITMMANVARLSRSMRKWRRQFGITLADTELNALVARWIAAAPTTLSAAIGTATASTDISRRSFE